MNSLHRTAITALVVSQGAAACTHYPKGFHAQEWGNDRRALVVSKRAREGATTGNHGKYYSCLSPTTSVLKLKDLANASKVSVGQGKAGVNVENKLQISESAKVLFQTSEIMQLAHAGFFRLCEARGNGVINNDTFKELYSDTFLRTTQIIKDVVSIPATKSELYKTRALIGAKDKQLSKLSQKISELENENKKSSREIRLLNLMLDNQSLLEEEKEGLTAREERLSNELEALKKPQE